MLGWWCREGSFESVQYIQTNRFFFEYPTDEANTSSNEDPQGIVLPNWGTSITVLLECLTLYHDSRSDHSLSGAISTNRACSYTSLVAIGRTTRYSSMQHNRALQKHILPPTEKYCAKRQTNKPKMWTTPTPHEPQTSKPTHVQSLNPQIDSKPEPEPVKQTQAQAQIQVQVPKPIAPNPKG